MEQHSTLGLIQVALRAEVCDGCHHRSARAEPPAVTGQRACERTCPLFVHLPRLVALVSRFGGEPPCGYALAVHNLSCPACRCEPATAFQGLARPPAAEAHGRTDCPLTRYAGEALAVVERVAAASAQATARSPN